jgi:hypothetical protein
MMKKSTFINFFVFITTYSCILLFIYAAVHKLLDFENFQIQLAQSPLLSVFATEVAYIIVILELFTALSLSIPRFRFLGLLFSFGLMWLFSVYIFLILQYASHIPCSCGGVLDDLGWHEHLIFNLFFVVITAFSTHFISKSKKINGYVLILISTLGLLLVLGLHHRSEHLMQHENPFTRRFIQGSVMLSDTFDLRSPTRYFAGSESNILYFGDTYSPLYVLAYHTDTKQVEHFKIQLDRDDLPFSRIQITVVAPHFYLMDGTVPVIYIGNIVDWKAEIHTSDHGYYFSKAVVIDRCKIAFRAQKMETLENIVGFIDFKDSLQVVYAPDLLQKQIDGFFDTDGMMHYDRTTQKWVYLYYYRNQYVVADDDLQLVSRGNTLDTTTKAKIKVVHHKATGQKKIVSDAATVNKVSALFGDLLFVNSQLIGKNEPKEMWKQASIIDVYDTRRKTYLSSFYIHDVGKMKLKELKIHDHKLYAIIGHHLHVYDLHPSFFPKLENSLNDTNTYTDQ